MILKSYRYLSAYNEYCEVNVDGAYSNMKLIIGIRESRTENWFLVSYLSKREGYFNTVDREQGIGNRDPETSSLSLILVYKTNVSKWQIGNKEPVPGTFSTLLIGLY